MRLESAVFRGVYGEIFALFQACVGKFDTIPPWKVVRLMVNKISNQTVHHQSATKFAGYKKLPACKTAKILTAYLILRKKNNYQYF